MTRTVILLLLLIRITYSSSAQNPQIDHAKDLLAGCTEDSVSFLTITESDTLNGHFTKYKDTLAYFEMIKRHHYHCYPEPVWIGFVTKIEKKYQYRDHSIIKGQYHKGHRIGQWQVFGDPQVLKPEECHQIFPRYRIDFKEDIFSISVFAGNTFSFSPDSTLLSGTVYPFRLKNLSFVYQDGEYQFEVTDESEVKFGHFDELRQGLMLLETQLKLQSPAVRIPGY